MNRAVLKAEAKEQIKGKIGILFAVVLVNGLIGAAASFVLSLIPVVGSLIASVVVTPALALSLIRVFLDVSKGDRPELKDAFSGFDDFWAAFKVNFLTSLFTFLWSLLFLIPGFVKTYAYSMSMYILAENPGKPALECIEESKRMTNGHKMDLFVLGLSFVGWLLLIMVTFGIAAIWVMPYMNTTIANAYESLKPPVAPPTFTAAEKIAE